MPPAQLVGIGRVVETLKAEFPDITISKIRFLETEGLVSPERAPSGYRKYSPADIDRLRYILRVQRDQYLPLKVIREHLEMMDAGQQPPAAENPPPPPAQPGPVDDPTPQAATTQRGPKTVRLTRRELIRESGLPEATLIELERQQMVLPRRNSMYYGRDALMICVVARRLQDYGMDTRHMRAIKQAAEHEAGLIEQGALPLSRRGGNNARVVAELANLVVHAHAALVQTILEH
ncbi:MAG: MerR family transcriptional regulator [Propionibacteriaceae bacterium]|uniref:DNA-binding domain n=1 Tax=Propionibacterium ruminifibrarum TaxID=1962131 RepID=A0A375HXU0_9ACTN|nr:MerR family transcriptional regulator [Propionibacterium ruminifibrarum]MBE6477907.1 MerR family transcriptional regulator [Propionibacteriaceae bacterium]SPF67350.1 Putative DNA-binding domain [Propionibacterium ruminifibrarum]